MGFHADGALERCQVARNKAVCATTCGVGRGNEVAARKEMQDVPYIAGTGTDRDVGGGDGDGAGTTLRKWHFGSHGGGFGVGFEMRGDLMRNKER